MADGNRSIGWILAVVALAAAGIAAFIFLQPTADPAPDAGDGSETEAVAGTATDQADDSESEPSETRRLTKELFPIAIDALAATEESQFDRAKQLWRQLVQEFPDDIDIRANESIAVLKHIEDLDNDLKSNSAKLEPAEQAALQSELADAVSYANQIVQRLTELETEDYRIPLVRAELLKARANLEQPANVELKKEAAQILFDALEASPGQPLLVGALSELIQVIQYDAPEMVEKLPDVLYEGYKSQSDNFYFLKIAAEALKKAEDPRLAELLKDSLTLTRSMWSTQQRMIDRIPPESIVDAATEAIAAGDWRAAQRSQLWLNVILGMEGFLSDGKRVRPNPLGLLDSSFLHRLAPEGLPAVSTASSRYTAFSAGEDAAAIAWFDFDDDLREDVVAIAGTELLQLKVSELQLSIVSRLDLGGPFEGLLVADFFEVETPEAPKLPATVAELMLPGSTAKMATSARDDAKTDDDGLGGVVGSRHGTRRDLLLWGDSGFRFCTLNESGELSILEAETGLEGIAKVTTAAVADIESDGDLDLLAIVDGVPQLYQNNGNRTFQNITQYSSLPPSDVKISSIVRCDYDRDLDQDFLFATDSGLAVFENVLHNQFRYRKFDGELTGRVSALDIGDIDFNGSWDFALAGDETRIVRSTNPEPGLWNATGGQAVTNDAEAVELLDVNNDTYLDMLVATDGGIQLHLGGTGGIVSEAVEIASGSSSFVSGLDRDYDGQLEILTLLDGKPTLLIASDTSENGSGVGEFLNVRVAGIRDVNGGGRINHYCLGSVLELWNGSRLQSRLIEHPVTHFGVGDGSLENLRVIFTNGLTQNVQEVEPDTLIEEKQLLRGSCPYVYGWDGQRWELITDLLWNAPLGLQVSRGTTLKDRRWENILLPGELVREKDGYVELRITEELWEVAYFDNVRLTAVDHPSDTRVFTNEKVGPPQLAEHKLFSVADSIHPRAAVDSYGRDVTKQLSATDRKYAQAFEQRICQGLTEPHFIEYDFGDLPTDETDLRLFLNGWLYPTDTSLNIGISQNPDRSPPEPPSLWIVNEDGKWDCAKPFIGFPGGKPKTIAIELDGIFQSDDHRIRIAGSQEIYWDEAFIAAGSEVVEATSEVVQQSCELSSADLHYRGYSRPLPRAKDQPHWFDYHALESAPKWPPLGGPYTRYGSVSEILKSDDDSMVVMKGGDEITLRFRVPNKPLPEGWTRDFVLYSTGWDKDADINTLAGQSSLPLPFMDQTDYPAPLNEQPQAERVYKLNAPTLTRYSDLPPGYAVRLGGEINK